MMSPFFRRTLVRRVTLTLAAAFVVIFVLLTLYRVWELEGTEYEGVWHMQCAQLVRTMEGFSTPEEARAAAVSFTNTINAGRRMAGLSSDVLFQVDDLRTGQSLFANVPQPPPDGPTRLRCHTQGAHLSLNVVEPELGMTRWLLLASTDLLQYVLLAFPLVAVPLVFAVWRGLLPLRQLADRVAARHADDLSPLSIAPSYEELKPLVASLDHLLSRLRQKIDREHMFVHDAAHELRTPLAVIAAQTRVLAAADPARIDEAEQRMNQAVSRGSHLIEQMLLLARLDSEQGRASVVDVAQLVRDVLVQQHPAALARGIEISLDAPDALVNGVDAHALQSVLNNLLDNAIRYGREGGCVAVSLAREDAALVLRVADDGPGIPPADQALVFERFHRGKDPAAPGSGLGLAIVRQAVIRMGGTVHLASGLHSRGCAFTVRIPLHPAQMPAH